MADNVAITAGSGTTIAADDVGSGVLVQRVKATWGPDGTANDADVATGKPLPVQLRSPTGVDLTGPAGTASAAVQTVQGIAGGVAQPVSLATLPALVAGTAAIGKLAANSGVDIGDVDVLTINGVAPAFGDGAKGATVLRTTLATDSAGIIAVGTAGTPSANVVTVQGAASMTPVLVTDKPSATANGITPSRINSAASNNLTSVKASAGQLYDIDVFNVAAYDVFLKLYNKASAPVVASDTPVWTIPIKAGMGYARTFPQGRAFSTGIAYAIVKLQADTDNTNVAAGDLTGSIGWI